MSVCFCLCMFVCFFLLYDNHVYTWICNLEYLSNAILPKMYIVCMASFWSCLSFTLSTDYYIAMFWYQIVLLSLRSPISVCFDILYSHINDFNFCLLPKIHTLGLKTLLIFVFHILSIMHRLHLLRWTLENSHHFFYTSNVHAILWMCLSSETVYRLEQTMW